MVVAEVVAVGHVEHEAAVVGEHAAAVAQRGEIVEDVLEHVGDDDGPDRRVRQRDLA
jgi:hypothetical protein